MSTYFFAPPSYHDGSFTTQRRDITAAVLEHAGIGSASRVLDVGCGAGQTLRVIEELNEMALLIGVDPDENSCRCGRQQSSRIHFLKGEGEQLPLADDSCSHVVCRVAINYMHQANTLREMIRVLAPGGKLVLSFIGFGYALREVVVSHRGRLRQWLGNLKCLLAGVWLQAFGYQGGRGTFWGRSVPYTSVTRLRSQLHELDCRITWSGREGSFLSAVTIGWAIIFKKDKRSGSDQ